MKRTGLLATAVCFTLSAGAAFAQSTAVTSSVGPAAATVRAFWTPARLASAKPLELGSTGTLSAAPSLAIGSGPQVSGAGAPPVDDGAAVNEFLYNAAVTKADAGSDVSPLATSSTGARFTTSRVFPDSATTVYPWRATGKLYFHDPRTNGNFICTASVLRPRVIATAGHCVYHAGDGPSQSYFYNNFLFVPAFRQIPPAASVAPYCTWTTAYRVVTAAWANGGGGVPNAQDFAAMESNDRTCTAGSTVQKLGNVTGYYGYLTNSLIPQSITQIGYPANLDQGLRMEVTWAQSFDNGGNNTVRIGSIQRGGASGGPWLKDFGVSPVDDDSSHPAVSRNQLVSVTSYGPIALEPAYLGGSILDNRFLAVLNNVCVHRSGNC